jgi:phospholipase/carboxylesterase
LNKSNTPERITIQDWPIRVKQPTKNSEVDRVLLLLHGHLGNENVMWILANPLPKDYYMLAPRAPVLLGEDQYSWHEIEPQWPDINQYQQLADQLLERVDQWAEQNMVDVKEYDVLGFSQGAVMAYALALLYPERIGRIAAIAGFIPQSWKSQFADDFTVNKPIFVAHGKQDDIIPIEKAHQAAEWLKEKGAQVSFCEADTGHKLSANCFNGMGDFFG